MGNDTPNPTLRLVYIPFVSGNDVNVGVANCLACIGATVYTDVVAIWHELFVQIALDDSDKLHGVGLFVSRHVKSGRRMPLRNDQRMSWRDGELVESCDAIFTLQITLGSAKRTCLGFPHNCWSSDTGLTA